MHHTVKTVALPIIAAFNVCIMCVRGSRQQDKLRTSRIGLAAETTSKLASITIEDLGQREAWLIMSFS